MPSKKTKTAPKTAPTKPAAPNGPAITKAEAARRAIAQGLESPKAATAFIKSKFGIEMTPTHFSAVKSELNKQKGEPSVRQKTIVESRGNENGSNGEAGLIQTLEALKPLVAQHGAEKIKKLTDLLG